MLHDLQRYLASSQHVDIIYLDRNSQTSMRTLRLHSVDALSVKAYCLTRRAHRVPSKLKASLPYSRLQK